MDHADQTSKKWDILALGCVTVDDFLYLPEYPEPDSKVRVVRSARQGGGLARTALVAASRLGSHCAYAGLLGHDEMSRFTIDDMQREGIDISHVVYSDDACPMHANVIVDTTNSTRTILLEVNGRLGADDRLPSEEAIKAARVLFLDEYGMAGNLRAAKIAKTASIPIVGDFEKSDSPLFSQVLELVDHLILSWDFARKLTGAAEPGDCATKLWSANRAVVIITTGGNGCWVTEGGKPYHQPAFRVPVLDTTGCGDVFHGAYAALLARNAPLSERVKMAAATAALKARDGSVPIEAMVEEFLRSQSLTGVES